MDIPYKSKGTPYLSATWGYAISYEDVNGGRLSLYEYPALVWRSNEVIIDVGDNIMCYATSIDSVWEKVCKTLGTYSNTSNGLNYYKLN